MAIGEVRLSIPGPGRTVASASEERAAPVREVVCILEEAFSGIALEKDFETVFGARWVCGETGAEVGSIAQRAAWALTNVWLSAVLSGDLNRRAGFQEAEDWFFGEYKDRLPSFAQRLSSEVRFKLSKPLGQIRVDEDFLDLLPYILEPHGPGSRLTVMRDPGTLAAWDAKRDGGVFYTPSDVAEYMVDEAYEELSDVPGPILALDTSCGTGVYLVALLRHAASRGVADLLGYAVEHLFGVDISARSVESCAFVLLDHCLASVSARGVAPWAAWQALRLNLAAADSLRLFVDRENDSGDERRRELRSHLLEPGSAAAAPRYEPRSGPKQLSFFGPQEEENGLIDLGRLFPELGRGCDLLVGNPPYTDIGIREDLDQLVDEYATLRSSRLSGNENTFLLFVEMMWRLTKPGHNAAGLVIPLSVAYHQGAEYRGCRQAMTSKGGTWRFAFFDREPHALFGEDVKTRNAIVFRRETPDDPSRGSRSNIETGPLRKWTSRTRDSLFRSIDFTPLGPSNITAGIPKLAGTEQSDAYTKLVARTDTFSTLYRQARNLKQSDAFKPGELPRVFVASTAYNFLNVYRDLARMDAGHPVSENAVHCLEFAREDQADLAFAVLSSRLTYWLWHVQGDGFHVARWFLESVPFGGSSFTEGQARALERLGRELWAELQAHRIVSVNRGKQTIAFRPLACEGERDAIDSILLEAAGLPPSKLSVLKNFVVSTVMVDQADARRQHLNSHFQRIETIPCPSERTPTFERRASSPRKNGGSTRRRSGT